MPKGISHIISSYRAVSSGAAFLRRRHYSRRPPQAATSPGRSAPDDGKGDAGCDRQWDHSPEAPSGSVRDLSLRRAPIFSPILGKMREGGVHRLVNSDRG
jgi:hypothetical protein